MMPLQKGDRVKLTNRLIAKKHTKKIAWDSRRGTVVRVTLKNVSVVWDGCKAPDPWPSQALERVEGK